MAKQKRPKRPVEEVLREEKLSALCQKEPATVGKGASLKEVLGLLQSPDAFGAVLVVEPHGEEQKLCGIFTERDYLRKIAGVVADLDAPVDGFMTPDPRAVSPEDTVDSAIRVMTEGGFRNIPVVTGDKILVGLLSTRDVILFLSDFFPTEVYNLPPHAHRNVSITPREGG